MHIKWKRIVIVLRVFWTNKIIPLALNCWIWDDCSQLISKTHLFKNCKYYYYSFKIFPRFWLAKSTRLIHHNQLLMTKFGRILCLARKWRLIRSLFPNTGSSDYADSSFSPAWPPTFLYMSFYTLHPRSL